MDAACLRTGDRATVQFEFISHPEFIKEGMKLLFREGKTKVRVLIASNTGRTDGVTRASGPWGDYSSNPTTMIIFAARFFLDFYLVIISV
jgi:hypothetical protein